MARSNRLIAGALLAALTLPVFGTRAAESLPGFGATLHHLTVSGISSGGYMAVQFQVAHSSLVTGAGVLAAGPYECAEGSVWRATRNCMAPSAGTRAPDAAQTLARIEEDARAGRIDPPQGLRDDRVWVFTGGNDRTVERPVVDALMDFYRRQLPASAIRFVAEAEAGHAMISIADPQPNACGTSEPPFINRCGDRDAAGELLTHLLGPLATPSATPTGSIVAFDQQAFTTPAPLEISMADQGYAYVPTDCRTGGCRVHVAFHGCRQTAAQIGRRFIEGSGYNAWADANRLIVLYPQVAPRYGFAFGSWRWVYNPKGCWDWWGYTGADYATRDGGQIRAVRAMLDRLAEPPRAQ